MFLCFSLFGSLEVSSKGGIGGGGTDCGVKDFTAFNTSRFMRASREEELPDTVGVSGVEEAFCCCGIAFGAADSVACLLRSSSSNLHRGVRISTVSDRSFFSVASLLISIRQASRSIRMFSFSNSSGERAREDFVFFVCLTLVGSGSDDAGKVVVTMVKEEELVDGGVVVDTVGDRKTSDWQVTVVGVKGIAFKLSKAMFVVACMGNGTDGIVEEVGDDADDVVVRGKDS